MSIRKTLIGLILILLSGLTIAEPFKLPTYGEAVKGIPIDSPFPTEEVFFKVIECLPQPNLFNLEIGISTKFSNEGGFDPELGALGKYYAGIAAKIPFYSTAEVSKKLDRASKLRLTISGLVIDLAKEIVALRKHEKELGLYTVLEQRAQKRIAAGVASTQEQIGLLQKVIETEAKRDNAHFAVQHARLALTSLCLDSKRPAVDRYLQNVINYSSQYVNFQSVTTDIDP